MAEQNTMAKILNETGTRTQICNREELMGMLDSREQISMATQELMSMPEDDSGLMSTRVLIAIVKLR